MTSYSTLQEAYNIDSFNTVRKKPKKTMVYTETEQNAGINEPFMNDYSPQDDCYYKKEYGVDTKVCRNQYSGVRGSGGPGSSSGASGPENGGSSISRFTNPSHQGAQQYIVRKPEANPSYVETSKLSMNSTEVHGYKSHQMNTQGNSCSPLQATNYDYPLSGECKKEFDKAMTTYTNDATVNSVPYQGSEGKSIQPYYDEDLEQYFDINNMTDAINYKSSNKTGYANDNTGEYRNMHTNSSKSGDDLLRTEEYNLSEDDKKQALQALSVLQSIEKKINQQKAEQQKAEQQKAEQQKADQQKAEPEKAQKPEKPNTFYNNLINIGLFIFIGIIFILLCDQITELAIQIGMKRAISILEPYLQKPVDTSNASSISSASSISNTSSVGGIGADTGSSTSSI